MDNWIINCMHGIPASITWFGPVWWGTLIKIYSPCNNQTCCHYSQCGKYWFHMNALRTGSINWWGADYQTIFSLKYWLNKEENMIIFYNVTSLYYKQHWANVTRQQSIGKGRDSKIQQGVRNRHNLATYPCGSAHVQYLRGSKISFICLAWPEICLKFVQRGWGPGTHVHHFQWSSRFFSQVVSQPPL